MKENGMSFVLYNRNVIRSSASRLGLRYGAFREYEGEGEWAEEQRQGGIDRRKSGIVRRDSEEQRDRQVG